MCDDWKDVPFKGLGGEGLTEEAKTLLMTHCCVEELTADEVKAMARPLCKALKKDQRFRCAVERYMTALELPAGQHSLYAQEARTIVGEFPAPVQVQLVEMLQQFRDRSSDQPAQPLPWAEAQAMAENTLTKDRQGSGPRPAGQSTGDQMRLDVVRPGMTVEDLEGGGGGMVVGMTGEYCLFRDAQDGEVNVRPWIQMAVAGVGAAGDCLPGLLEDCDRLDSYGGILSELECLRPDARTDTLRAVRKELIEAVCAANQQIEPNGQPPECEEPDFPPAMSLEKRSVINQIIGLIFNERFSTPYLQKVADYLGEQSSGDVL